MSLYSFYYEEELQPSLAFFLCFVWAERLADWYYTNIICTLSVFFILKSFVLQIFLHQTSVHQYFYLGSHHQVSVSIRQQIFYEEDNITLRAMVLMKSIVQILVGTNVKLAALPSSASGWCWRWVSLVGHLPPVRVRELYYMAGGGAEGGDTGTQSDLCQYWWDISDLNLLSMMVSPGGEVTIECLTDNVISRPEYVLWTFNGKVISN